MKNELFCEMYEMYKKGYSVEEVGKMFGRARQNVWMGFKIRKWPMRTKAPLPFIIVDGIKFSIIKTGYYVSTRGRLFLHRHIWEKHNGPVPNGYDIHHIDKNKTNNSINNLQILSHGDHKRLHNTKVYPPRICKVCGKEFTINGSDQRGKKTCTNECARELTLLGYRKSISKYGYGRTPKKK